MEDKISMSSKPIVPSPEQMVQDAVANSRLSGCEVREDVKAVMLRIARGEMSADQLAAWDEEQKNPYRRLGQGI